MKNYFINDNNCKLFGVRSGIANAAKRGESKKLKTEQLLSKALNENLVNKDVINSLLSKIKSDSSNQEYLIRVYTLENDNDFKYEVDLTTYNHSCQKANNIFEVCVFSEDSSIVDGLAHASSNISQDLPDILKSYEKYLISSRDNENYTIFIGLNTTSDLNNNKYQINLFFNLIDIINKFYLDSWSGLAEDNYSKTFDELSNEEKLVILKQKPLTIITSFKSSFCSTVLLPGTVSVMH